MDSFVIVLGLLFWGACGLIAGNIAKDKGRDPAGWAAGGLILGPIGVALAAIASPEQEVLDRVALNRGELRKCPGCQELIKAAATKCRYCGDAVEPVPAPEIAGTCFLCGTELFDKVTTCPRCGRKSPLSRPAGMGRGERI